MNAFLLQVSHWLHVAGGLHTVGHERVDFATHTASCYATSAPPMGTKVPTAGSGAHDRYARAERDKVFDRHEFFYARDITPQARILLSVYPENRV
jgi:hypothetical protein